MLTDMGTELPALTKIVVAASDFLIARWYIVLAVVALLVIGILRYRKTEGGGRLFGRIGSKAPLIGKLTVKSSSARMARTMSTLLGAGIPMIEAIDIVARTMGNVHFREALLDAKDDVAMGDALSVSIEFVSLKPLGREAFPRMPPFGMDSGSVLITVPFPFVARRTSELAISSGKSSS